MAEYGGIWGDMAGYGGMQRDTAGYRRIWETQRDTAGYSGIQRDIAAYRGIQDTAGYYKNILQSTGVRTPYTPHCGGRGTQAHERWWRLAPSVLAKRCSHAARDLREPIYLVAVAPRASRGATRCAVPVPLQSQLPGLLLLRTVSEAKLALSHEYHDACRTRCTPVRQLAAPSLRCAAD